MVFTESSCVSHEGTGEVRRFSVRHHEWVFAWKACRLRAARGVDQRSSRLCKLARPCSLVIGKRSKA